MHSTLFAPLALSFMLLVALLYSALIMGAMWANNRVNPEAQWAVRALRFFTGGFLLIVGMLALDRFFLDFSAVPPHLAFAVIPAFIGVLFLSFHPLTLKWIREIPQRWLIGLQSFRFVVEIQLYFLFQAGLVPKLMTFEGRNFDILIGLTAPFVAWYVHRAHRQGRGAPRFVVAWNVVGLVLVTNVFVHGLLSFPTPFRVFVTDPVNTGIGTFPYVWLPAFLVPFAYLLHILSLRREWSFYKDPSYKVR